MPYDLLPVDHDPFAFDYHPVDHDPFAADQTAAQPRLLRIADPTSHDRSMPPVLGPEMGPRGGPRTYTGASGEKVIAPDYGAANVSRMKLPETLKTVDGGTVTRHEAAFDYAEAIAEREGFVRHGASGSSRSTYWSRPGNDDVLRIADHPSREGIRQALVAWLSVPFRISAPPLHFGLEITP